jgi:broad specificity phosphatase PhoE
MGRVCIVGLYFKYLVIHVMILVMKQIILIRHAKVDIDNSQAIDASSLKNWVDRYDIADIHFDSKPTQKTSAMVGSVSVLVTSSLKRTIDSAKVLGADIYESSAIFNEAQIPNVNIPFLKFKPKTWLMVLRVLLLFGLGKKDASMKASKLRAEEAAKRLLELSDEFESVVLVGHGGMNWLIRKVLIKEGWDLKPNASHKNWGVTILKLEDTKE